jgi:hypothetical protein
MSLRDLRPPVVLLVLAALAVLAYAPTLTLPLVSDDYTQIWLGRRYGPAARLGELAHDPLYRSRATSIWVTYWTEKALGVSAPVLNASSLILHIVNTWLVFALGAWRAVGWRVAAVAAAFFAVHEGHQEAVMWYAALPELLVFTFVLLALLAWIRWVEGGARRPGWYAAAVVLFILALASKESAVVLAPLAALVCWTAGWPWRRTAASLWPLAALALGDFALAYSGREHNQHFHDGTFSLAAPVWATLPRSALRLFWIWGVASLAFLWVWRARLWARLVGIAGAWVAITLLPYSFLTYMPRVPSRHLYLASVGLALVVAAGFWAAAERWGRRPWAVVTLAALIVAHNCAYLWTRKREQYLRRAAPVEALIDFSRKASGRIEVRCFVYGENVARHAIEIGAGKPPWLLVWNPGDGPADESAFCDETQP